MTSANPFNAIDVAHPERARFMVSVTAYDHPDAAGKDYPVRVLVAAMYGGTADYLERKTGGPVQPLSTLPTSVGAVLAG